MKRFRPAVHRNWLIFTSGIMWSGVGVLLNWFAYKWLPDFERWQIIFAYFVGILAGLIIAKFGFSKLAAKNRDRILGYPEKVCAFAFQRWEMYILVVFMISLGIFMRTSGYIPKYLLAPVYIGIGLALFIASFVYYKSLIVKKENQQTI
jgi:hypothetical protein